MNQLPDLCFWSVIYIKHLYIFKNNQLIHNSVGYASLNYKDHVNDSVRKILNIYKLCRLLLVVEQYIFYWKSDD